MRTLDRSTGASPTTPLGHLARSLRARARTPGGLVAPAAILWADPRSEWRALIPAARSRIPELFVLGDYDPGRRTGPAIWLRCVIDRALDVDGLPAGGVPIVYLPGVERGELRAGEDCPAHLKPLVELMYRGALWHHPNGRDWSVTAFLGSSGVSGGPDLDIAADRATAAALRGALGQVAVAPVAQLRGRRLNAADFNRMAGVDVARDILQWMGDPGGTRSRMAGNLWRAFRSECRAGLGFDPETDADVAAGELLGRGEGRWTKVWARFNEAPDAFPGVPEVLVRSRPAGELLLDRERWPDLNDEDEEAVAGALSSLPELSHPEACRAVARLEEDHGARRRWVWARLGRSPFAEVLKPLARLATVAGKSIGGTTPGEAAQVYAEGGWLADAGAREALALAPAGHEAAVASAVRHLLEPWLDESARAFQAAVGREPLPAAAGQRAVTTGQPGQPDVTAGDDECVVFVDGLRYELGRSLAEKLEARGCTLATGHRWAAIPTVTATAKPAVTPIARDVAGDRLGADFRPAMRGSGRPALAKELRKAMRARGYQILGSGTQGSGTLEFPLSAGARGWLETGEIDKHGHHHAAAAFARQAEEELDRLAGRIHGLLEAGWNAVRVVTDHGWLLLPGGLPMVSLPNHLAESKWARCAVVSAGSAPDAPLHPWHWNAGEWFASPPGVACFSQRPEYAHGGLSLQECLIPDIRVRGAADGGGAAAKIQSVSWVRYRCHIAVHARGGPLTADLRLGGPAGKSVVSKPKTIDDDGLASLVLADDEYEDAALALVVIDAEGRVLAQQPTRTGENA